MVVVVELVATMSMPLSAQAERKSGPYWSWQGPTTYWASYAQYGITIHGPSRATMDVGLGPMVCAAGTNWSSSVGNYFSRVRRQLRNQGWRFDNPRTYHPTGDPASWRRQTYVATWSKSGTHFRGRHVFDYGYVDSMNGVNYCGHQDLSMFSLASAWAARAKTLQTIRGTLVYRGPETK